MGLVGDRGTWSLTWDKYENTAQLFQSHVHWKARNTVSFLQLKEKITA